MMVRRRRANYQEALYGEQMMGKLRAAEVLLSQVQGTHYPAIELSARRAQELILDRYPLAGLLSGAVVMSCGEVDFGR